MIRGDVRRLDDVDAAVGRIQPTHVFHLAASRRRGGSIQELPSAVSVNTLGAVNVVASAAAAGCGRVVVLGTAEEYGPIAAPFSEDDRECPVSAYGISKLAGSRAALAAGTLSGTEVTIVRATVAYGAGQPTDMFLPALLQALVEGRTFPMTEGRQTRDFIYIDDLVDALVRAAATPEAGGLILNIGSGETVTVRQAAHLAERVTGVFGLLQIGAIDLRETEASSYGVDLSRAQQILGWGSVRSLEQGIADAVTAMKS